MSDALAEAGAALLESLGEYVRQSMMLNPEWSAGIAALEALLFERRKRAHDAAAKGES